MRIGGQGDQELTLNHNYRLASQIVGEREVDIQPTGVYDGFDLSIEANNKVRIHPGTLEIRDERGDSFQHQVRTRTTAEFVMDSVTPSNPYLIARWHFDEVTDADGDASNYVAFESSSWPANDYWIILGKASFDGSGNISSLDPAIRDVPRHFIEENFDFVIQSQEDVHKAFEDPDINDIFVHAENGPFRFYHEREDRKLNVNGRKVIKGDAGMNASAGIHFQEDSLSSPLLEIDAGFIFEDLLLHTTTDATFIQTVVDYSPAVLIKDIFVRSDDPNGKLLDFQSSSNEFQATVTGSIFHGFDNAPVTGTNNVDDWTWHTNSTQVSSGSWTDDKKLYIEKGSRLDAETVDGHTVTRAQTFANANNDELLPKELIEEGVLQEAQGLEGSVDTVDDLPQATNVDGGSVYAVSEDLFESGRSDINGSGGDIEYPAGLWIATSTTGDNTAEEWNLLTKDQTDVDRDEWVELKPTPTSPPSMDILIQEGPYTRVDGTQTESLADQTVTITAPSSDARIDLISIDDDLNLNVTQGNVSASPEPPIIPSGQLQIAEVKVNASTTEINQIVDDLSVVSQGVRDVRPFINKGGAGGGLVPKVYTDVLPAGSNTISLPFDVQFQEQIDFDLDGVDQFQTEWSLDEANNEINLNETFEQDKPFEVKKIEKVVTGVGIQRHIEENVSEGTRIIDPPFPIAQDGSDTAVFRNNGFAIYNIDYFVNGNGNVEFNFDLSDGEDIVVIKLSGGSTTTSHGDLHAPGQSDAFLVIDQDEGTISQGSDTITVPFDITRKAYVDLIVGGVPVPPSGFTLPSADTIQLTEAVDADMDYFVDVDNYIL